MGCSKRRLCSSLHKSSTQRLLPAVEALESRTVPYATIGAWPHPELVTLSFMPDGTPLGGSFQSNLFASFNAKWPTAYWQGKIMLAAQTWAQYTNLNFAVVPDNGVLLGTGAYQQGDPGQGDIRIGGFNFGTDSIGGAWFPPPLNNYSAAGDLFFNTAMPFNIGSTYDLFTVATHELGHSLGLLHSPDYYAAMYGVYVGGKGYDLTSDDIAGIRSIYSAGAPRSPDGFGFYTSSFQTASDLTGAFYPVTQTFFGAYLDITHPGQAEYYRFLAPDGTSSQLTVTIQSSGLSLLSPYVVLYDANLQPIAAASGYGQYGTTISVTASRVVPGQQFWLRVSGAEVSPLGIGRYALILNFGTGPSPTVPPANTATPNGNPIVGIGSWPERAAAGQPDSESFDSFEIKPEQVSRAAQDGSLPRPLRGDPGLARVPVNVAVLLLHPAIDQPSQGPLLVYAVQPSSKVVENGAAGILAIPLFDSRVLQPASARIESGGGHNAVLSAEEELSEEEISLSAPAASLPDAEGGAPNNQMAKSSSLAVSWHVACTAYFAEEDNVFRKKSSGPVVPPSGQADAFDSAAALAGLTVALGGYWGAQRREVRDWRKALL